MSSHMKDLPGYFDDNPEHLNSYPSNNFNDYQQGSQMSFKQPALLYQNSNVNIVIFKFKILFEINVFILKELFG